MARDANWWLSLMPHVVTFCTQAWRRGSEGHCSVLRCSFDFLFLPVPFTGCLRAYRFHLTSLHFTSLHFPCLPFPSLHAPRPGNNQIRLQFAYIYAYAVREHTQVTSFAYPENMLRSYRNYQELLIKSIAYSLPTPHDQLHVATPAYAPKGNVYIWW